MVRLSWALCDNASLKFREIFEFSNKHLLKWFPGHMGKGLKQMQQKLKTVDCILEIHDARIPLTGRNVNFKYTVTGVRPHVLILNKMDLADLSRQDEISERLKDRGISEVLFTNCKNTKCKGLKQVVPTITRLMKSNERFNRSENEDYRVMVIGLPNVGKSSLINSMRNKHLNKASAARVGAIAGITRSVSFQIKVCQDPLIYLLDTPGILDPVVNDVETAFKLALCSSMQDHLVSVRHIADYLLYFLNKRSNFDYVHHLGLTGPMDSIEELLIQLAISMGKSLKRKDYFQGGYTLIPDIDSAAQHFIKLFRTGELGKFILDDL